jgi:hypothetical protein
MRRETYQHHSRVLIDIYRVSESRCRWAVSYHAKITNCATWHGIGSPPATEFGKPLPRGFSRLRVQRRAVLHRQFHLPPGFLQMVLGDQHEAEIVMAQSVFGMNPDRRLEVVALRPPDFLETAKWRDSCAPPNNPAEAGSLRGRLLPRARSRSTGQTMTRARSAFREPPRPAPVTFVARRQPRRHPQSGRASIAPRPIAAMRRHPPGLYAWLA